VMAWLVVVLPLIGLLLGAIWMLRVIQRVCRSVGRTTIGEYFTILIGLAVCIALFQVLFNFLRF
jgi:hypothetical protein